MQSKFMYMLKYILFGDFITQGLKNYTKELEYYKNEREMIFKLKQLLNSKNHSDEDIRNLVRNLPRQQYNIFKEKFPDIYNELWRK